MKGEYPCPACGESVEYELWEPAFPCPHCGVMLKDETEEDSECNVVAWLVTKEEYDR